MANIVDRLFDQILAEIDNSPLDHSFSWPDPPFGFDEEDWRELPTDDESLLFPIASELPIERTGDRSPQDSFPPVHVSKQERELIEWGIRDRGMDVLAFYKSRRFRNEQPFRGKWGIFYLKQGLLYVAGEIASTYPGYGDPRTLAHGFLYAHEFFHYQADIQTLMFESVLGKSLYIPLRNALLGRRVHFVEEALANKSAYTWARKPSVGLQDFAFDFMSLQPGSYARFTENRLDLNGEWLANTIDRLPPGCTPRSNIAPWMDTVPKELLRQSLCPQYVVDARRLKDWIHPAWVPPSVKQITENDAVKKLISGKYKSLAKKWAVTKERLLEDRLRRGLNFKQWKPDGKTAYSVRIDREYRAHLRHEGNGTWEAYILGNHKELGHG